MSDQFLLIGLNVRVFDMIKSMRYIYNITLNKLTFNYIV